MVNYVSVRLADCGPWAQSVAVVEPGLCRIVEADNKAGTLAFLLNDTACQSVEKIGSHDFFSTEQIILRPKASNANYASFRIFCSSAYVVRAL